MALSFGSSLRAGSPGGMARPFRYGDTGQLVPMGASGRGSVIKNTKQVKGGLPIYDETYDEGRLSADAQYELGRMPWDLRRDVFNQVQPLLGGLTGEGNINFGLVGGQNTPMPALPNSFVYSPQQIQQQVNAARAQGDQGAMTQKRQIAGDLAGRGFGARSPLAMALQLGADTGARARNADQEREIRFDAAGANAKQDLSVGQLAQLGWNNWNQLDVERRKTQAESALSQNRNMIALISALSGLA